MTNCTCDTFSASSNATILTIDQTSASSTAGQVMYAHSANGNMPYVIYAEGATTGVLGKTYKHGGNGVFGQCVADYGFGVYGQITGTNGGYAIYGDAASAGSGAYGVYGLASQTNTSAVGVYGSAWVGVWGNSPNHGGYFTGHGSTGTGLYAQGGQVPGTWAIDSDAAGSQSFNVGVIRARASMSQNWTFYGDIGTLYNNGPCTITGALSKGGGGWRTDHPTKPDTHFLNHGFVESDVMRNEYPGNATLDSNGEAVITMPEWFPHVNADPSVTVTGKGKRMTTGWDQVDVCTFKLFGDPGAQVSYTISCRRNDAWTKKNCPGIEIEKTDDEKGLFMHPELFGQGAKHLHHKVMEATNKSLTATKEAMAAKSESK